MEIYLLLVIVKSSLYFLIKDKYFDIQENKGHIDDNN